MPNFGFSKPAENEYTIYRLSKIVVFRGPQKCLILQPFQANRGRVGWAAITDERRRAQDEQDSYAKEKELLELATKLDRDHRRYLKRVQTFVDEEAGVVEQPSLARML